MEALNDTSGLWTTRTLEEPADAVTECLLIPLRWATSTTEEIGGETNASPRHQPRE